MKYWKMKIQKQTNRQKEIINKLRELESRQTISIKEIEELKNAIWKFILEYERLTKRYNKLIERENGK
ncbi:MAG TPA: hypothetical protein VMZ91_02270 [Candidatus Paceibacterota bacterium]|nr:hypothetical protein [Candidatus Paceibacterota bacterium]